VNWLGLLDIGKTTKGGDHPDDGRARVERDVSAATEGIGIRAEVRGLLLGQRVRNVSFVAPAQCWASQAW
jgi:hypothetical protein